MGKLNKLFNTIKSIAEKPVSDMDELIGKIKSDNEEGVKKLILSLAQKEDNILIDAPLQNEDTLLNIAIDKGNLAIVKLLLDAGANKDEKGLAKYPPLMNAILANKLDIAKELVDQGADIQIKTEGKKTPLDILEAMTFNQGPKLELISAIKSKLPHLDENTQSVDNKPEPKVAEQHVDDTNKVSSPIAPPPISAYNNNLVELFNNITTGNKDNISKIPKNAKFINHQGVDGDTPLTLAIKENQLDIAYELLNLGAKSNIKNKNGESPLQLMSKASIESNIGQQLLERMTPPQRPPSIVTKKQVDDATKSTNQSTTSNNYTSAKQILQEHGYPESKQAPKKQADGKVEVNNEKISILAPPPPVSASTIKPSNNSQKKEESTDTSDCKADKENKEENNDNFRNAPEM